MRISIQRISDIEVGMDVLYSDELIIPDGGLASTAMLRRSPSCVNVSDLCPKIILLKCWTVLLWSPSPFDAN